MDIPNQSIKKRYTQQNNNNSDIIEEDTLNIIQLNKQRGKAPSSLLVHKANELKTDLVLIQEPYNINKEIIGPGSWLLLYKPTDKTPKTCIGVRNKNIDIALIPELSSSIITTAIIQTNIKVFLLNVYLSPYMEDEKGVEEIANVLKKINSRNIIVAGDINAKSPVWYNIQEDKRGRMIVDLMKEYDLISVNMSDHPTFFTAQARGWTDVCLMTNELAQNIKNCETLLTITASDHRIISTQIGTMKHRSQRQINYVKHINWELFKRLFNDNWTNTGNKFTISEGTSVYIYC
ncbi:uncharacterized protein LOC111634921 [Centruroides sculpturatus]|uniref:uncharacterized protein LOC111634921 n=1 Tax=Centruroides sculpturatus TaxID=218467 RepID=UPI000C6E0B07|nr:uncharacterized protein LOC111634921 [Centruroides sculpturatus]